MREGARILVHHWLQDDTPLTIENVVAQAQAYGVRCAYDTPAQLGADRWAALVAARVHVDGSSCVIDCGTAMTIDVLTADGRHAGGLIVPGLEMMRHGLTSSTGQIRADEEEVDVGHSLFTVHDTSSAVQAGIMAASEGAVQQVLEQCFADWRHLPKCVLTGGDAEVLLPLIQAVQVAGTAPVVTHEADWVLKGLAIIAGCHE